MCLSCLGCRPIVGMDVRRHYFQNKFVEPPIINHQRKNKTNKIENIPTNATNRQTDKLIKCQIKLDWGDF